MTPEKKIILYTSAMMSLAMSLMLSGFFTWLQRGFTPLWLPAWTRGFFIGWPLAFLLVLVIGGPIRSAAVRLAIGGR